jgi:hypothetical protein
MAALRYLPVLSESQVDDLKRDLWLQEQGTTIYYAIDPHEIYDFCFPSIHGGERAIDAQRQSDDQIALFELFFKAVPAPLLMAEYGPELERILDYVRITGNRHYAKVDNLNHMIERSAIRRMGAEDSDEKIDRYIKDNFSHLLAAIMGVYSLGGDRLIQVASKLGESARLFDSLMPPQVAESYNQSEIVEDAMRAALAGTKVDDPLERSRMRRSALTDALVVDQLIHINAQLESLRRRQTPNSNLVIAYLSSAQRTERIFRLDSVHAALPDVRGEKFSIWRTRAQFFTYAAYKVTDDSGQIDYRKTESNLDDLKAAVSSIRSARSKDVAELKDPVLRATVVRLLDQLEHRFEKNQSEIANLGLASNIGDYRALLADAEKSHTEVGRIFRSIYKRHAGAEHALSAMRLQIQTMLAQSELGRGVSASIGRDSEAWLRDGRDAVTSSLQYLPIKPTLATPRYAGILNRILEFFTVPTMKMHQHLNVLLGAYNDFLKEITSAAPAKTARDGRPNSPEDADRELVRCYLYFSFLAAEGDERAYGHAVDMARMYPARQQEFDYVACWAARRTLRYLDGWNLANAAIKRRPDDPRMYHGRALTTYAWLADEKERGKCKLEVAGAIQDLETAIRLYKLPKTESPEMTCVCLNNLAHLYSSSDLGIECDLAKAQIYFDEMTTYMPKETWGDRYPEFYHTSATLHYGKANGLMLQEDPPWQEIQGYLLEAAEDANAAVRYYPTKGEHRRLKDEIDRAIEMAEGKANVS